MTGPRQLVRLLAVCIVAAFGACTDPSAPIASVGPVLDPRFAKSSPGIKVSSTSPSQSGRDTTLDVAVSGSGFEAGSRAQWLLSGVADPRVVTNSTRFVSSTSVVANITVSKEAAIALYDVSVITPSGKTGIGTEMFAVQPIEELSSTQGTSNANDVNAGGIIAGGRAGGCSAGMLPAYWRDGGLPSDLPLLGDACNGFASFINESGVIIGRIGDTRVAVRWVPNALGEYDASGVIAMGALPEGSQADLKALNNGGIAVGNHNGSPGSKPYWWSDATGWTQLPMADGATQCYVEALTDTGEASGLCTVAGISSAVVWSSLTATPVLLPRLGGHAGSHSATVLNANGVAAGYATRITKSGSLVQTGVRWTRVGGTWGNPEVLPDLGAGGTQVWDINDDGVIVGASWVGTGKNSAFILVPGQSIRDLGGLGSESWGFAVTPAGAPQVIVAGVSTSGSYKRATVWRP